MKTGLDVKPLVTGHQFRGIGVYVKKLLQTYLHTFHGNKTFFAIPRGIELLPLNAPRRYQH